MATRNLIGDKKIEKIFNEYMEGKLSGKKVAIETLMKKYGYTANSALQCSVTKTQKWHELLEQIDDEPFMNELSKIALGGSKDSDKIKAITEILKLKRRYPEQQKTRGNVFQTQVINQYGEDERDIIEVGHQE